MDSDVLEDWCVDFRKMVPALESLLTTSQVLVPPSRQVKYVIKLDQRTAQSPCSSTSQTDLGLIPEHFHEQGGTIDQADDGSQGAEPR